MTAISIHDIHKSFQDTQALAGVSFEVSRGEIAGVLGPSGCGKSTLLNIIGGVERPDQGDVRWEGRSLSRIPPHNRGFGLMFQDFALFPHMDVYDNIAFGLKMEKLPSDAIRERVAEMLELVNLPGYGNRDVNTLSGGEKQRVALARSLAPEPRLLMLDEPLGSLDRALRERLMVELRRILKQMGQTAIYVTHDQEEAFAVSDWVVVMKAGEIVQIGTPQEIYRRPESIFVARFLGFENLLEGTIQQQGTGTDKGERGWKVGTAIGGFPIAVDKKKNWERGEQVMVLLRPDAAHILAFEEPTEKHDEDQFEIQLTGELIECSFRGNSQLAVVEVEEMRLTFEFPARVGLPGEGEKLALGFDSETALQIFEKVS